LVDQVIELPITNLFNQSGSLKRIDASCGCSVPRFPSETLAAGDTKLVKVLIDSNPMAKKFPDGGSVVLQPVLSDLTSPDLEMQL
jgi:hypothetical protein